MPDSTRISGLFSTLTTILLLQLLSCSGTDVVAPPAPLSGITVHLRSSGPNPGNVSLVSLDGDVAQQVATYAALTFPSIRSGKHSLVVSGFADNCKVDGPNPIIVDAPPSDTAMVEIDLTCTSTTGVISVAVASSGSWDPRSFSVQVDDEAVQQVTPHFRVLLGEFGPGAHVVKILNASQSCTVVGAASTTVSITVGKSSQDTVETRFDVRCILGGSGQDEGWEIAFQRGDSSVVFVHADGSGVRNFTRGLAPSWSPDGKFLAYQRPRCVYDWSCSDDLWMIRPNGSEATAITNDEGFYDAVPAISPDGRSIAFMRFWLGPEQNYLMVSDVAGTSPRILVQWSAHSMPTWSPNGSQIALSCEGQKQNWETDICVVKVAAGCTSYFGDSCQLPPLTYLTDTRYNETDPAWSPDGLRIAITLACNGGVCPPGVADGEPYVALLDPITRAVKQLAPGHSPAWSPDGQYLVFAGNISSPGLKVIGLDGTGLRSLTNDLSDTEPSWR